MSDLPTMTLRFTPAAKHLEEKHLEKCLGCGRKFVEDDTTHLGYAANGRCILVGDCCSVKLSETAIRHRYAPRPFYSPSAEQKLWRYMNFAKYAEMLRTASLYFSRLGRLG